MVVGYRVTPRVFRLAQGGLKNVESVIRQQEVSSLTAVTLSPTVESQALASDSAIERSSEVAEGVGKQA